MRGKHADTEEPPSADGITPADAGKTGLSEGERQASTDHPRGCGENRLDCFVHGCAVGSPPRMRGKPFLNLDKRRQNRITPADAGKTGDSVFNVYVYWDHPRGCGENAGAADGF